MFLAIKTPLKIFIFIFLFGFAALVQDLIVVEEATISEITPQQPLSVFPDFSIFTDVETKKLHFLDYVEEFVAAEIRSIISLRSELVLFADNLNKGIVSTSDKEAWFVALAREYRVDLEKLNQQQAVNELLLRVDLVPASLALAQAANESAWGTSRFTVQGNNIFGQWCYEEGCGMVPARRPIGAKHEVKFFDTIQSSVKAYFLNINTHDSYSYLRNLRAQMRDRELKLDPMSIAIGLGRYSERGDRYVDEVQRIIIQNNLRERDG